MDTDGIEEQAARWIVKRDAGAWTRDDETRLHSWLDECTAHRVAYLRLESAWRQAARLRALGASVPPGTVPPRDVWGDARFSLTKRRSRSAAQSARAPSVPLARPFRRRLLPARLLATASCLLLLTVATYLYSGSIFAGDIYATPIGGMRNIHLMDGSQITLNTNTCIHVLLTGKERRVHLDHGEAYFAVAHDTARPFIVYVGNKRVMAVGTRFAVLRDGEDVRVVVTEGRVRLTESGVASSSPAGETGPAYLTAGDVARTWRSEIFVQKDPLRAAEKLLSWRSGYLDFTNTRLAAAVREFNRYTPRKIVIADPAIGAIRIGGSFRTNNVDAFLKLLGTGFPVRVSHSGDQVTLQAR
jgi:transmembrane sensor